MKEDKKMSKNEILAKIEALNEWEQIIEEAKAAADELRNSIKEEMDAREVEELIAGQYIIRFTSVTSSRFNTTAFKAEHNALYKDFLKEVSSRRFTISC